MRSRMYSAAVAAGVFALAGMALNANAATLVQLATNTLGPQGVQANPQPNSTLGTFDANLTTSTLNVVLSPYQGTATPNDPYNALAKGGATTGAKPGLADYSISPQSGVFSLLWGSPDKYNTIYFFTSTPTFGAGGNCTLGGGCTGAFTSLNGDQLIPPGTVSNNPAHFVQWNLTGITDVVLFDSGQAAFEWADQSFIPGGHIDIPLPAALPLVAGGLGLVGLLSARKRRKAQAAAA